MLNPFDYIKISAFLELTYTDKNNEAFSFNTRVIDILPDRIKMSEPVNKIEKFAVVEPYEKLDLNFYSEEGVYSANVNFLDFEDNTFTNIYISYPYNNSFTQRRAIKRNNVLVDGELDILNTGNGVINTIYFKTKDISTSGTAFITKKPLPEFDNARLILHFEEVDITAFCKKIYSKETYVNEEKIYLNGLKFNEISKEDIRILNKESLKLQLDFQDSELVNLSS